MTPIQKAMFDGKTHVVSSFVLCRQVDEEFFDVPVKQAIEICEKKEQNLLPALTYCCFYFQPYILDPLLLPLSYFSSTSTSIVLF